LDVSTADSPAYQLLRHLASWDLEVDGRTRIDPDPSINVGDIVQTCVAERVTGVVLDAIEQDALASVPTGLIEAIRPHHLRLLQQSLMAEADLVLVAELLDTYEIEHRVLKGLATAHLDHDDPALRSTSDVDILVRQGQLGPASAALRPLVDLQASSPDRRRRHTELHGKDRTLKLASGGWLDLHQFLAAGYWGAALDHDRLFDEGETFDVGSIRCHALAPQHRFLHALLHAGASDRVTIQSIRDVAVLEQRSGINAIAAVSDPYVEGIRAVLARGALLTEKLLGTSGPLQEWARDQQPTQRERIALRVGAMSGSRSHWTRALALPPSQWPGFFVPLAFPSREYLQARDVSWGTRLRSAVRSVSGRS
jgi:hypothetical protein